VKQKESSPELKTRLKEHLEQQGYEVTEGAKLSGKSGIEHTFDMLARREDGFTSYTIAIGIASGGDREVEVDTIFSFANKAYDCGILDRILIAIPELSQEKKQLARKQRIQVIDGEQIDQLLTLKPKSTVKPAEPVKLETRKDLVKSLINRGYEAGQELNIPLIYWLILKMVTLHTSWGWIS